MVQQEALQPVEIDPKQPAAALKRLGKAFLGSPFIGSENQAPISNSRVFKPKP